MLTKSSVLLCQINKPLIKVQSKYIFISCISVNITHFKYSQENEIKRSPTTFKDSLIALFLWSLLQPTYHSTDTKQRVTGTVYLEIPVVLDINALFCSHSSYLTIPLTLSTGLPGGQHMVLGLSDCNRVSSGVGKCWTSLRNTSLKQAGKNNAIENQLFGHIKITHTKIS